MPTHVSTTSSQKQPDLIASLEYQGKGTIHVDGQPCTLTQYRISTSYQTSGQRTRIACTRPNGQAYANIEVLSGAYAWNEDIPGAELIAGKGRATPMPAATEERMIRLWAGPQGGLKAALAGIQDPPLFAVRPGSGDMRITERLTRQGNEVLYEVTVQDPESFLEPWVMTPRTMRLNTGNDAGLIPERANCEVYETGNITTQLRHGLEKNHGRRDADRDHSASLGSCQAE